ncbi:MAG: S49 family peptidase, partial [Flavisolibacter sp.]|nr:S49 family peptidase [Flavisolibacter sp.]
DSIAQGRVWSGEDAVTLGLVDKLGGLQAAIDCAARLAKTKDYRLREYPEKERWLNTFFNKATPNPEAIIRQKLGEDYYRIYKQILSIQQLCGAVQARLPYQFFIH